MQPTVSPIPLDQGHAYFTISPIQAVLTVLRATTHMNLLQRRTRRDFAKE